MGRPVPVWAEREAAGQVGSRGTSSVGSAESVTEQPFRTSAEIVALPVGCLPTLRRSVQKDAADLFWRAFDGDSLHAKAIDAASKIRGVSADTFVRLYDESTEKVEYGLIVAMLYWHQAKHGRLPPLPGLIARAQKGGEP